jgi:hypothetical protein
MGRLSIRLATLALLFGSLCMTSAIAAAPRPSEPSPRAVAAAIPEPGRIVRPGLPAHVYHTPPPPPSPRPAPAPAHPQTSVGVMAAVSAPAPHPIYNWLHSEDGRISVGVGVYDDPTGQAAVPEGEAVLDLAMRDVPWYFDGHNPGVFTPLLDEGVGSYLDYWDSAGREHRFRIVAVRTWYRLSGEPPPVTPLVVAQFQTCKTLDGSVDYIYDAVAA